MGFDYHIHLCLHLCPETGEAFVGYYRSQVPYEAEKHRIPVTFRKYLHGRGRFFLDYMPMGANGEIFSEFVDVWYNQFPCWGEIEEEEAVANEWTEEDHNNFKDLLKWFIDNGLDAVVSWSY